MSFFGTSLTLLTTVLHFYLYVRLDALLKGWQRYSRKNLRSTMLVMWLVFFFGRLHSGGWGILSRLLEIASMHWMATLFLLCVGLFAADLICGFGHFLRRQVNGIRTAGLAVGLILALLSHIQGLRPPEIVKREVTIKGLASQLNGTKIVVMADWHAGKMMLGGAWLQARIDQAMALKPDLILLAGDLFEQGTGPDEMIPAMRSLSAPLGVWAVRGNHDALHPKRRDISGEILKAANIQLLENKWVELADGLVLAGIDDLSTSRQNPGEEETHFASALSGRPDKPTLFLSHTPWMVGQAVTAGVDLMISGHTHNGQIWPFNYLVKLRYPYITGEYSIRGMPLIVSRGTGTWGPRMRLWDRSEITLIILHSK